MNRKEATMAEKKLWEVKRGYTYIGAERDTGPRNKKNFKGPGEQFYATKEEVGPELYKVREIPQAEAPPIQPPRRKPGRPRKVKTEDTMVKYPPVMPHVVEDG
jgi:hypothetical protein